MLDIKNHTIILYCTLFICSNITTVFASYITSFLWSVCSLQLNLRLTMHRLSTETTETGVLKMFAAKTNKM